MWKRKPIIYADDDILVVDKPCYLCLANTCLITRVQQQYSDAFIVYRLDMDTSGIMILARSKANLSALSPQFQERETHKEYLAWVYGLLKEDAGEIDLPLICDWPKQMVDHELGKPSLTRFEVLESKLPHCKQRCC